MWESHTSIFSAERAIGDRTHLTQKEHHLALQKRGEMRIAWDGHCLESSSGYT